MIDKPTATTTLHSARSVNSLVDSSREVYPSNQSNATNLEGMIPHSYSAPTIPQYPLPVPAVQRMDMGDLTNQFSYMDTIEALHRRHLEEKHVIAGIKQKI